MAQRCLRGALATVDAMRNAHTVVGVARQLQAVQFREAAFDPRDAVQVTDVVLRHHAGPAGDDHEIRLCARSEKIGQFLAHQLSQLVVGEFKKLRLERAADEHAEQHAIGGRATGEFDTGEARSDDPPPLYCRYDEPEPIESVLDLRSCVCDANDRAASVFDLPQLRS